MRWPPAVTASAVSVMVNTRSVFDSQCSYLTGGNHWGNCQFSTFVRPISETECNGGGNSWTDAQRLYGLMKRYIENGAGSYFAWNMVLDDTGMSTWKWRQDALITVNQGTGKVTFNDPDGGTLRFFVPAAAAKDSLHVNATEPGGMALEQAPEDTKLKGVYRLAFPMKPGETRVDIDYALAASDPARFAGKVFYQGAPTRLVVPSTVTL